MTRAALFFVSGVAFLAALGCGPMDYTMPPAPTPSAPTPPPTSQCDHGTLAQCAASCRADLDGACEQLGKRTCKEGSVLECQAACDGDNVAACDALADIYDEGERVSLDREKAVALHARGCAKGARKSCTAAGDVVRQEMDQDGADTDRLTALAISYYDAGCDRSNPDQGDAIYWRLAPSGPTGNACAQLLILAPDHLVPALEAKCADASRYHRDPDGISADACEILADGKGVPRDAKVLGLRQLCARDAHSESCGRLKDVAVTTSDGGAP